MSGKLDAVQFERDFLEAVKRGQDALLEAGRAFVRLIERDATARQRLIENSNFTAGALDMMERIGRGMLLPRVALSGDVRLALLPVEDQRRITEDKVDALVLNPDGTTTTLRVDVLRAPQEMRRQVVNGNHIRTVDEQRAWLAARGNKAQAAKNCETVKGLPFKILGGGKVEINGVFSRKEVTAILQAMG